MNLIVICPCCASPVDAEAVKCEQKLECVACGQQWSMVVDRDRQAEFALT